MQAELYCDGSCHVKKRLGAWAAFIYIEDEMHEISGVVRDTTNQAMELTAVISSIQFLVGKNLTPEKITVFTDSQYVCRLPERRKMLEGRNFGNRRGEKLPNWRLVIKLYTFLEKYEIEFRKIAAHQPAGKSPESDRLRAVDKLARQLVRKVVRNENV